MLKRLAKTGVLSLCVAFVASSCGETKPPSPASQASVAIESASDGCDAAHPMAAHVTNISKEKIDGVEFVILGQDVGHSDFLANSGPIRTDKIMEPGEVYSICVENPTVVRPTPTNVKWNYTVEVQNVWREQES